ncbi:hypothetical protein [Algoriphagus pacificus]|uniref:Lipocalin-like domain-containing protein n=1 Tax=Algoriphagus pacificus TaxID=2811234 RepID=A0ABS3CIS5_9BACT|nr:hypothetical protein [Algoriphagus pacificus]MBN7816998.1 hypothetical protein [Algoriphagus pacificus]
MKARILISLISLTVFFSCQEIEEVSPYAKMEGRWEQIFDVNGLYEGYHIFEFKKDGTYIGEMSARTLDTKELIGYRGIEEGLYEINENKITLTRTKAFSRDVNDPSFVDDNSPFPTFVPKDALIPDNWPQEIAYWIADDFSELRFICPENSADYCVEFTTYVKVTNP